MNKKAHIYRSENNNIDDISSGCKRVSFIGIVVLIFALVVSMRLTEVSMRGGLYGVKNISTVVSTKPERGNILDRNGKTLATNIHAYTMIALPKEVIDIELTAKELSQFLGKSNYNLIINKLSKKNKIETVVKRRVSSKEAQRINLLGLPGIKFRKESFRFYPSSTLASHLVGHVDTEFLGLAGIEKSSNKLLTDGLNISSSIDIRVQHATREELKKGLIKYNAEKAVGIVADVNNGEILSMVNLPDFNPNIKINPLLDSYRNSSTVSVYEMGSTYKIFTIAAAIEYNTASIDTLFDARKPIVLKRHIIKDFHPTNSFLTTREVFIKSSNIGSTRIAWELGAKKQKEFLFNIGLLSLPNIGIDERSAPIKPKKWGESEVATVSYGYGLSVSPVQMVAATSSIVNGGLKVPLTIYARKNNYKNIEVARVISPETSKIINALLKENVNIGTGKKAKVSGYQVGGKTATAKKISKKGGYYKSKNVSSFISVFPINNPKYIVLVLFDEPKNGKSNNKATGGLTAAPVAGRIIKRIAPILGVERDISDENKLVKFKQENFELANY